MKVKGFALGAEGCPMTLKTIGGDDHKRSEDRREKSKMTVE